jgi:hypothetical protein
VAGTYTAHVTIDPDREVAELDETNNHASREILVASLAGPAGIALVEDPLGRVTVFIADYYNGTVRAVDLNGVMRNVSGEGRVKFGAPSRGAFAPGTGWLYVADASNNQVVALNIPVAVLSRGRGPAPRGGGAPPGGPRSLNRRAG